MSIWDRYFSQTVGVYHFKGTNSSGDTVYFPALSAAPKFTKCRIDPKNVEILDKKGNTVLSEAVIYTASSISPLDIISYNGRKLPVKACKPIHNLNGKLDHYEVYI